MVLEFVARCSLSARSPICLSTFQVMITSPQPKRWLMISFAFMATVINYLDRQTLSVVAPILLDRFHMDSVDYSRVVSAFLLAYTVSNGISGPLIDRLGTVVGYAVRMLVLYLRLVSPVCC